MKAYAVPTAVAASFLVKWCIGLGSYSGQGTPPMYGDYEAQRHWMELTIHLPPRKWYTYDLQYWGLDYPPLTAYVSWICGQVGALVNPAWVALDSSRGIETPESKLFMRSTVMFFDTLIYVPALYYFIKTWQDSRSSRTQHVALLILLLQPALLLIDNGHFQYNSVMLGLTLFALSSFAKGQDLVGAAFFVLSLGFKQMALYYAPAIGTYLLGKCIYLGPVHGTRLFVRLAAVTTLTFALLFAPFLPPFAPVSGILDPLSRIFPFNRGLFEDKVANFWCLTNVAIKWKQLFAGREHILVRASAAFTILGFAPAVAGLAWGAYKTRLSLVAAESAPAVQQEKEKEEGRGGGSVLADKRTQTALLPLLPYALLTSAMSFFLFSFQVHEKTILLPLMPLMLLLSGASHGGEVWAWGVLGANVGAFSMWPLLKRDGLGMEYMATLAIWNRLVGFSPLSPKLDSFVGILSFAAHTGMFALHFLELIFAAPARYPDLFPVLNVLLSAPVFGLIWIWSIKRGIQVGWALGGLGPSAISTPSNSVGGGGGGSVGGDIDGMPGQTSPVIGSLRRDAGVRTTSMSSTMGRTERKRRTSTRAESVGL
ncbi:glycosyltransferase family 57 protein [Coniophora puteana RWD-64-598 SS2]|uniref:Alpha-1,3-glucosyltransferase n=1 Tax=Coniophora puteana (strain RWD-64-598) TaxID=741705 RepID=A0A5M3MQG7_CONPW|nr:glycosyltransferase family 57 protein [Coniophora puteana RWD-64-598 SS2]EIW81432.1 glycosyltransferase family 57 protein [Coniophora puteana RWD-64-598 SS2]